LAKINQFHLAQIRSDQIRSA